MKTSKKLKASRMWANYYMENGLVRLHEKRELARSVATSSAGYTAVPVAVIPLDDVGGLVENAMQAYADCPTTAFKDAMAAALSAIGVLPRARKGRK